MQVADNEKNEDGDLEKHRAGDLYDWLPSSSAKVVKPANSGTRLKLSLTKESLIFL